MPNDFHEISFPLAIALGSQGGPARRTEIVTLGSGREHRNARWAHARRRYDAGSGVADVDALHQALVFFEERRGRLYGFRWRDRADWKSCAPSQTPQPTDQRIGTGDGARAVFQLVKTYGADHAPYERPIRKPVAGSVRVAVDGVEQADTADFTVDATTGEATFAPSAIPGEGAVVTAGYLFDTPVRFEADDIAIDFAAFEAGALPKIPLVEILV
jgi:uncharacterized protein (TIGR02217 family)